MDIHELTAPYALDALGDDERTAYEQHLAQCERCRAELAELGDAVSALAFAVRSPEPPAALRSRILDAAAAERVNVVPLRTRRPWLLRTTAAAAAVAACAAAGLAVWGTSLSHSLHSERSAAAAEHRAMQIYMDPRSTRTALRGGSGTLAVDPTGQAALVVHRLRPAPSGKTYEAWVIPPGSQAVPAGTFDGGEPMTMLTLGADVPIGSTVATTLEPEGGSDQPTTRPILTAQT